LLGTRTPANSTLTPQTSFNLSGYSGTQVKIKLETLGASNAKGVGVDDITVNCQVAGIVPSFVGAYDDLSVGNVTTYGVTGLTPATTYYYRVRATAGLQESVSSNTESATTATAMTVFMFQ
jgi:hypothetical protein